MAERDRFTDELKKEEEAFGIALDGFAITTGHCYVMTQCICGDLFHASGSHEEVTAKQTVWDSEHEHCSKTEYEAKTFWLSFCDNDRPEGSRFLGACVIDVTKEEVENAALQAFASFPFAQPDAEYVAAAISKAHRLQCNPGGEVATMEIPSGHVLLSHYQRGILMDRETIERIDREIAATS